MGKKANPFVEYILSKLMPHGSITARAMFGGYGIYYGDVMFASIVSDRLYFRIDESNRKDYEPYQSEPFIYEGAKKPIVLPYLTLPQEILDNDEILPRWIEKSRLAALRYKRQKIVKKSLKKSLKLGFNGL